MSTKQEGRTDGGGWSAGVTPILVLTNWMYTGGAERYTVTVANRFREGGADVTVAATPGPLSQDLHDDVRYVPMDLGKVRVGLPRAAYEIGGILKAVKPKAIIANSVVTVWAARIAAGRQGIPIISVAHGWPAARYRWVARLLRVADVVVAVSEDVRNRLVAAGLDPEKCEVVLNGVDCGGLGPREGEVRERARAAMGAGPDDVVILNVGRLEEQKAHQDLIAAAAELVETHPNLRFAVAGGGTRLDELQDLLRTAGLEDRFRLLGQRRDVPDLLGSADIYASSSLWEGMPLSTIEAMASGLPCVVTRTEGCEALLDEDSGVVVPVGDPAAMAAEIARLAADPERRRRLGTGARTRALSRFSHERMVEELGNIVTRAVASRGAASPVGLQETSEARVTDDRMAK